MTPRRASVSEADLHAWVDDRLDPGQRDGVATWLDEHSDDRARVDAWFAIGHALREHYDAVLEEPIPKRLLEARALGWPPWIAHAAVAIVWASIGAIAGWTLHGVARNVYRPGVALTREAADAFVVYAPEIRHPVEVAASRETHLVHWLSKRLGEKVRAPDLGRVGYSLVGGRLLPDERGHPAAQFMYQNGRGDRIVMYLKIEPKDNHETAFRYARQGDVRVFYWIDGPMGYAVAGRIPKDELSRLANESYRQLNP